MWVFSILAVLLPVFLTTMADLVPLFQDSGTSESQTSPPLGSKLLYIVSVGCIGVLITLEFSYLHTLRKSAAEWIPMLLVALALDLIFLLILNFVIRNPDSWNPPHPSSFTIAMLILTTIFATISSFSILVLARVAGALHDGQFDIQKVIDSKKKHEELKIRKLSNTKTE